MKARCKYCHELADVEQMHKDKFTEEWYHLSCTASLSRTSSDREAKREAKNETIRAGLAKASRNGKKIGRPRKAEYREGN